MDVVAITHAHLDHIGSLVQHANLRDMIRLKPATYLVPPEVKDIVRDQFKFWSKVQGTPAPLAEVIALEPGTDFRLPKGNNLFLRSFKTNHGVPSQGYLLLRAQNILKEEYRGDNFPGKEELYKLEDNGVEVYDYVETPLLAFTGDTTFDFFETCPQEVLQSKVLITECTFLAGVSIEKAVQRGHCHLDQFVENAPLFDDVGNLYLTHLSKRYQGSNKESNKKMISEALEALPKGLREKTSFMAE
jgi:ribonuclease Z